MNFRMAMPLLGKELTEQAARKRTYVLRSVYATLLFGAFLFLFPIFGSGVAYGWQQMLGMGRQLFEGLMIFQFIGVILFLPAMMSGVVAAEKEQASLGLLFLTDMGPWELLLQKYLGRLIPMLCFLLLSLPLMAIAYSFGGITTRYLLSGALLLLLACLQIGALALMGSTVCRTTTAAFLFAYLGLALFYFLPALSVLLLDLIDLEPDMLDEDVLFGHIPMYQFFEISQGESFAMAIARGVPAAISVVAFLLAARVWLVRRAFTGDSNPLLGIFRSLDNVFARWNARIGGIEVWKARDTLPDTEPVAWYEMQKRGLARRHYLVRIGLLIETPVLLLGLAAAVNGGEDFPLTALTFIIWILAVITLTVQGANTIVAEHSRQTMDVLLSTPLAAADIVRQKARALNRLVLLFAVPLFSLTFIRLWCEGWARYSQQSTDPLVHLLGSILSIAVYLPLTAWVSLWIGLGVKRRMRAIFTALAFVASWCALAPLAAVVTVVLAGMGARYGMEELVFRLLLPLSPASALVLTEIGEWKSLYESAWLFALVFNFVGYGAVLYAVRRACLTRAAHYLRRERE